MPVGTVAFASSSTVFTGGEAADWGAYMSLMVFTARNSPAANKAVMTITVEA